MAYIDAVLVVGACPVPAEDECAHVPALLPARENDVCALPLPPTTFISTACTSAADAGAPVLAPALARTAPPPPAPPLALASAAAAAAAEATEPVLAKLVEFFIQLGAVEIGDALATFFAAPDPARNAPPLELLIGAAITEPEDAGLAELRINGGGTFSDAFDPTFAALTPPLEVEAVAAYAVPVDAKRCEADCE